MSGRWDVELDWHDKAARAQYRGLLPQHLGRVRNIHQDQPPDDRIERAARRRVVDVALNEPQLRQAALFCPPTSSGERLRRPVDTDHVAIGSHQVSGHEGHVPRPAAQIQHPHARPDASRGEDHPRSRGKRPALQLKTRQLVFIAAKLVVGVAAAHRRRLLDSRNEYRARPLGWQHRKQAAVKYKVPAGLRSGNGPLSLRARPSSIKHDCDRSATGGSGKRLANVHAKSCLTLEPNGHTWQATADPGEGG